MMAEEKHSCGLEKKACIGWAMEYFKDCLCDLKDEISFGFGIASLVCWGVAEIPQIVTNFNNKSAQGVSLAFISTWIVGDVFNLIGCLLEPATLPTQYYTAVLYTSTTVVLALQCLYYDHFLPPRNPPYHSHANQENEERNGGLTQKKKYNGRRNTPNRPIQVPNRHRKDSFHFISARSLAGSDDSSKSNNISMMPKSGPADLQHLTESSSDDENGNITFSSSYPNPPSTLPRPVGYGTFAAASAYLPRVAKGSHLRFMGRGLLTQEGEMGNILNAATYGQCLGWLMAAIYMGGRLPQIWLNIKRGSVEGLNPLMFIFALIANATYVGRMGSILVRPETIFCILVRSTEWEKIKPNMPWLLDAFVCVALDLFIIVQYIFYRFIKRNKTSQRFGEYYQVQHSICCSI